MVQVRMIAGVIPTQEKVINSLTQREILSKSVLKKISMKCDVSVY